MSKSENLRDHFDVFPLSRRQHGPNIFFEIHSIDIDDVYVG